MLRRWPKKAGLLTKNEWGKSIVTKGLVTGGLALFFFGVQAESPSKAVTRQQQGEVSIDFFESKIRPVLQTKCVACHGENLQSGDLRLDRPITPEMAAKIKPVIDYKGDVKMPPAGKLPADELAALTLWAEAGAPWPETPNVEPTDGTFWAFVPPVKPEVPSVKNEAWVQNPIDAFVIAKLEEKGWEPAPKADKRTLIRRATFDLTGLPPTPEEVTAFLADESPDAFEKLIDRLMETPAYGERWGRHWLDVARYADSNGLDENLVFPNAWRYRDWVVRSINEDMPIDEFLMQQLAGDLMPNRGDDGIIATGFLSMGAKMLAEDDPDKMAYDIIDEQVDTFSKAYLGITMSCARCHDHKFDPIPAKDYYALAGIFRSTKTMVNHKVVAEWVERPIGPVEDQEEAARIDGEIKTRRDKATKLREDSKKAVQTTLASKKADYEEAARQLLNLDKNQAKLTAVIGSPNGKAPQNAIVWEAENFKQSNLIVDKGGYGKDIGVLLNGGTYPNYAVYEVEVPMAGAYQLDLRYSAGDARAVKFYANGTLVLSSSAAGVTGGFYPQHQKWEAQGIFNLKAGKNTIRFERESYVPHIDKLLLIPRPGATPTDPLGMLASNKGLLPEIIRSTADQIKAGEKVAFNLPENADHLFDTATKDELKKLDQEIADLQKSKPVIPRAMAVEEGEPTDLKVHLRGNYLDEGELAPRQFPTAITGPDAEEVEFEGSGRFELADWVTQKDNPLTARVFVNRVWRWRFGKGIVATTDNFGALGEMPSHPELLDYLATTFVEDDEWSLKKLHKRMMLTSTYQMSTALNEEAIEVDPDNRLLWRFNRQRLEAEAIRDSILFVAGQLDREMGGTLLNIQPRAYVTSDNNINPVKYDSNRRSLYLPVVRSALYSVYTAFDYGDPAVMNGDRPSTIVAPQALFMLNSDIVLGATKEMASSVLEEEQISDAKKIQELYMTCFGRPATEKEVALALEFLPKFELAYAGKDQPKLYAWQSLCKSLIASNEFIYVD